MAEREKGNVKWFDGAKGYGFIVRDNVEKDVFVHQNSLRGGHSLNDGDRVEFSVKKGDKGPLADDVVVLD